MAKRNTRSSRRSAMTVSLTSGLLGSPLSRWQRADHPMLTYTPWGLVLYLLLFSLQLSFRHRNFRTQFWFWSTQILIFPVKFWDNFSYYFLPPSHFPCQAIYMIPTKPPPTVKEPEKFSPEFCDFISKCLVKNPEERPSATALLQHKFLRWWCNGIFTWHHVRVMWSMSPGWPRQ